jgi:branched-chain amino acid transport system permease protein
MNRQNIQFMLGLIAAALLIFLGVRALGGGYYQLVAFYILQYVVLATAWNILGGYGGYVNFGSAGFFAIGAYSTVFFNKLLGIQALRMIDLGVFSISAPFIPYLVVPAAVVAGAFFAGLVGLGMGYLTLRLRGVFFAIATLALAVVAQTVVLNWSFVGGARGAYVIKPTAVAGFGSATEFVLVAMIVIAMISIWVARTIERNKLGVGLLAIRDDEDSAECAGVPTLRLKLQATTISGALMGAAGAVFPFFVTYVDPIGAFNLVHTVNSIAMPLIGGMTHWSGPVIGAVLLGGVQQYFGSKNIITPELSLLFVGALMMIFVALAPNGILGLWQRLTARWRK